MICNTLLLRTKFQITPLLCLFFGFIGTDFIILRQTFNRPYQILCKDRLNVVPTLVDLFSISLQRKNNSAGRWCMGKHFQKTAEKTQKTFSSSEPYIGQVFYSWVNQKFSSLTFFQCEFQKNRVRTRPSCNDRIQSWTRRPPVLVEIWLIWNGDYTLEKRLFHYPTLLTL